nr:MAG TPA: hypothetical protein [Bacteriophage sp.]
MQYVNKFLKFCQNIKHMFTFSRFDYIIIL